jgi:hypothetical protein
LLSLWKSSRNYGIRRFIKIFISSIRSRATTRWTTCDAKNSRLFSLISLSLTRRKKTHSLILLPLEIIVHLPLIFFFIYIYIWNLLSFLRDVCTIKSNKRKTRKFLGKECTFSAYFFWSVCILNASSFFFLLLLVINRCVSVCIIDHLSFDCLSHYLSKNKWQIQLEFLTYIRCETYFLFFLYICGVIRLLVEMTVPVRFIQSLFFLLLLTHPY